MASFPVIWHFSYSVPSITRGNGHMLYLAVRTPVARWQGRLVSLMLWLPSRGSWEPWALLLGPFPFRPRHPQSWLFSGFSQRTGLAAAPPSPLPFSTEVGSDAFQKFLHLLGDTVTLKGWTGYRGGLDTKSKLARTALLAFAGLRPACP